MRANCRALFSVACAMAVLSLCSSALAAVEVQVGYADDLRPSPFFPIPWDGGAGVQLFAGGQNAGYDTGAVRVINNGALPVTINDLTVDGFGDGASFHIWSSFLGAGYSLNPGQSAIFAQTTSFNFDSSDDEGGNPAAIPKVHLTINGGTIDLSDTAQVLNTEGTDHLAANNLNESHQWRDIGTFGGQAGVPEPSTFIVWSLLASSAVGLGWWRKRSA
jgi:hypothetical protein